MLGKRVARQIKKVFDLEGDELFKALQEVRVPVLETQGALSQRLMELMQLIDESYQQLDTKVSLAQSNLELSQGELVQSNSNLQRLNSTFDTILNSLSEGLLTFDAEGTCGEIYSVKAKELLGEEPTGLKISGLLGLKDQARSEFDDWVKFIFEDRLPFERAVGLGPKSLVIDSRQLELTYRPIRDESNKIICLLLVIADKTNEILARKKAEDLQEYSGQIVSISKNRFSFSEYLRSMNTQISWILSEKIPFDKMDRVTILRWLHDMKAASGTFYLMKIKERIHKVETSLVETKNDQEFTEVLKRSIEVVREDLEKVLALLQRDLGLEFSQSGIKREVADSELRDFWAVLSKESRSPAQKFQEQFVSESLVEILRSYEPGIQGVARRNAKEVLPLLIEGNFKVDRSKIAEVLRSLQHIFSNCVVHGIEEPGHRLLKGKKREGQISIKISESRENLSVLIQDDGQGVDTLALTEKIRSLNLGHLLEHKSESEIHQLIFLDAVSTQNKAGLDAGRGVGLSALQGALKNMGGSIRVASQKDIGANFEILIPKEKV